MFIYTYIYTHVYIYIDMDIVLSYSMGCLLSVVSMSITRRRSRAEPMKVAGFKVQGFSYLCSSLGIGFIV